MTTTRFSSSSTPSDPDLSILAWIGIPALALASIGGIGIVGSGLAIGFAAEELLLVGAGAGLVARKAHQNSRKAQLPAATDDADLPDTTDTEISSLRRGDF